MYSTIAVFRLALLLLLPVVTAYPGYSSARDRARTIKRQSPTPVDVSGAHRFLAPSGSDLRGPCPGLNAAANHGYIPHNGYATVRQAADGVYQAFGMGTRALRTSDRSSQNPDRAAQVPISAPSSPSWPPRPPATASASPSAGRRRTAC